MREHDFTPLGLRLEGQFENDRNRDCSQCFKDIIREAFKVTDVIVAHHLTYVQDEQREDGSYEIVEEIPSADALIFDHDIALKIWGADFKPVLMQLACEPVSSRDALLQKLYYGRVQHES